jgi:DNA-binding CsgD family transcriptional regulator
VFDRIETLSDKERRVVDLVTKGRSNFEVAERLQISPKTVEWTLTKVYRKLRVRSRTELTARLASVQVDGFPQPRTIGFHGDPAESRKEQETASSAAAETL